LPQRNQKSKLTSREFEVMLNPFAPLLAENKQKKREKNKKRKTKKRKKEKK
tara:strand:- start:506 stop:658 length:153 start_codon:yes stop_codon:yes gene_type:complete